MENFLTGYRGLNQSIPTSIRTSSQVLEQVLHHHIVQARKGLLPSSINPYKLKRVLDLYCHSGAWAIDLARTYAGLSVIGIDPDPVLIEIARHNAEVSQVGRILFYEYSAEKMRFPVADQSCDLVHLFLYAPLFRPAKWPVFLEECWRVLKVEGSINLVSLAWGPGSGEAYSQIMLLAEQLLQKQGYSFTEQAGPISPGVFLCHQLRKAGFGNVRYTLAPVNFGGWNNSQGRACCQLLLREMRRSRPLLLQHRLIDEEKFEELMSQQQREIESSNFCTTAALISILGIKA